MQQSNHKYLVLTVSLLLILAGTISPGFAATHQTDTVEWFRAAFPPVTIPAGQGRDSGFFDKVMFFMIERLPEYEHQHNIANFKRIIEELKRTPNTCCPSLYKTKEREVFIEFSEPALVVLPNGIISTTANRDKLQPHIQEDGSISLSGLLSNPQLSLGISNGRLYSGGIDPIIAKHRGQDNIIVQSGSDVFRSLLGMLKLGRVDYILGYPTEARYFTQKENIDLDVIYYPVKESHVTYTVGYIGCSKSAWSKELIGKINQLLRKYRKEDFFIDFYSSWLDDDTQTMYMPIALEYFDSLP